MIRMSRLCVAALGFSMFASTAQAQAAGEIRLAITTFLSGAGAVFGVPARDAAQVMIDDINAKGGIKGVKLRAIFLDEATGIEPVTAEFRRLAQSGEVDIAIAGLSSSTCLALAPLAEQLSLPTILWDCGTSRIFEEASYKFVFRTSDYTPQNNVAAAMYLLKVNPNITTIAGINPDYAFGRDNWAAFRDAVLALKPDVKVVAELFPKLGSTDFSTEISRLSALRADVVFSTLWGGDMNTFLKQASSRNLFRSSQLVSPNGESAMEQVGASFPENSIIGARGDSWAFSPFKANDARHQAFVAAIKAKSGVHPIFPSYHMAQALSALQAALEKGWDGSKPALQTAALAGLKGLALDDFTGRLAIRADNQAVEGQLFGITKTFVDGRPSMSRVTIIPSELVTPPVGAKSNDWIKQLNQSALGSLTLTSP